MAKKPNYGFEKRQRELGKQKKAQEKAARRKLEKEADAAATPGKDLPDKEPLGSDPLESH